MIVVIPSLHDYGIYITGDLQFRYHPWYFLSLQELNSEKRTVTSPQLVVENNASQWS